MAVQYNSVFVSGNDIYVAGTKLWKNGEVQKLPDGKDHPGGNSVYISGSDVYLAGRGIFSYTHGSGGVYDADFGLWKNGVVQNIFVENETRMAKVISVFVVEQFLLSHCP